MEETAANMMLEELFDDDDWMLVNDTIGAIAQYDNIDTNIIDNALQNLSTNHRNVIYRFRHGRDAVLLIPLKVSPEYGYTIIYD